MSPLTRRQFLSRSLAGAGGLLVGAAFLEDGLKLWAGEDAPPAAAGLGAWVRVAPDGAVTVLVAKSEMGQGVYTSLPMAVADELEADWKRVAVEAAPAADPYKDPAFGMQATGGSNSLRHTLALVRAGGAAAREMLTQAAAAEWGVPASECEAVLGEVKHAKSGRALGYGALAAKAAALPVPAKPALKDPSQFRYMGKAWPRLDMADKSNGRTKFGIDTFVEGMLYGVVARPPAYGQKAGGFDEKAALAVPGVRGVAAVDSGVGVVADTLAAAWKGRDALAVRWSAGSHPDWGPEALDKLLKETLAKDAVRARDDGDAEAALAGAAKKLEAEYRLPYLTHATMEPMNCTADVRAGGCDVWAPTQNQTGTQAAGARVSGLPLEKVKVHTTYLGGGFGRRFELDFVLDALQLSKAAGKPVKVIWTREEDMANDFYRPGSLCRIRGGLDAQGKLVAYAHKTAVSSIMARVFPGMIRNGIDHSAVEGISDTPYAIPNLRVEWARLEGPVPVGFWRSVGNSSNAFTVESFLDELAHAAKRDPLEFRLELLKEHPRSQRLLKLVAEKAGWGKPLPKGRALGLAQHSSFGSTVATAAEVSVDREDGTVTVHRVVCGADCGPAVNVDTAKGQLEGATLMGLSAALKEEIVFGDGGVKSRNFDAYDMLRIDEAPEVEALLLDSDGPLGGLGEPGVPPVAPAVANAVFRAVGARVRRLPMTPERVLDALKT